MRIRRLAAPLAIITALTAGFTAAEAQTTLSAEVQATVTHGDNTPLWLNANRYGLSSLSTDNGYVRAALTHSMEEDSLKDLAFGYGADVAVAHHFTSTVIVQQLYGEARWHKGVLTIGSKEQPVELRNQLLSSGAQTLGCNAMPWPGVRVALPLYWEVPGTKGWLAIKGNLSYGIQTDDQWQKDFTAKTTKYTEHTYVHTKAGYLRFGKEHCTVALELGLEMGCQFGGKSHQFNNGTETIVKNDGSPKAFIHAFVPAGFDSGEGDYKNKEGNHLGNYLVRVSIDKPAYHLAIYGDHFFEDSSQMLFFEYDGYGEGEEWNDWKYSRWFLYRLKDMMLGAEIRLKKQRWVNDIVAEYIYSKHQSGALYHDRTPSLSDHFGGCDDYYNHYIHPGWQHWGQVAGNPLYRSPLYNHDQRVAVENNRFVAWHLALSGQPTAQLYYRLMATWQKGFGSYELPTPKPVCNSYLMAEARYAFPHSSALRHWTVTAAVALDHGQWTGNNVGTQLTLRRTMSLSKRDR